MIPTIRVATLEDSSVLLKFEQGVIEAERPFDTTLKEGEITYYDISELITSLNSEVFVAEIENEIVASGYVVNPQKAYIVQNRAIFFL